MDAFGKSSSESERKTLVVWPSRCANALESELREQMSFDMTQVSAHAPMVWIDGETGEFSNADEYADLGRDITLAEAMELRRVLLAEIAERYRLQLITARESEGDREVYKLSCEVQGIDPII